MSSEELIVICSAVQSIIALSSPHGIESGSGDNPVNHVRAGNLVVTLGAGEIESARQELIIGQRAAVGEAEGVHRPGTQHVIEIERIELNRIAIGADANQQITEAGV